MEYKTKKDELILKRISIEKLFSFQKKIASKAKLERYKEPINYIGGVDQAFYDNKIISAIVVMSFPDLNIIEEKICIMPVEFPYITTLLGFREGPAIMKTVKMLEKPPDIFLFDGSGVLHPQFCGIATQIGVILNIPTIGVTKSRLCGEYKKPEKPGEARKIFLKRKHLGYIYLSKKGCNPIFISPGHRISVEQSLKIVKACIKKYKIPMPIMAAHLLANSVKKQIAL